MHVKTLCAILALALAALPANARPPEAEATRLAHLGHYPKALRHLVHTEAAARRANDLPAARRAHLTQALRQAERSKRPEAVADRRKALATP